MRLTPPPLRPKLLQPGFTIVELLIVIVVIGILAAVTVVSYNGVQQRATNANITAAVSSSVKLLRLYHAQHGTWPIQADAEDGSNAYCLLGDNPAQRCGDIQGVLRYESDWLNQELGSYGSLPAATGVTRSSSAIKFYRGAPTYTATREGHSLQFRDISSLTYSSNAPVDPWGRAGSRFTVKYGLAGDDADCSGVQGAQNYGVYTYSGTWTQCVVLLESLE